MSNLKFQLKPEARQFFDKKYHTAKHTLPHWKEHTISEELLDEVQNVSITYGHYHDNGTYKSGSLCGWKGKEQEAHFHFTLVVSDIDNKQYENVNLGKLMDKIQKVTNEFFKN